MNGFHYTSAYVWLLSVCLKRPAVWLPTDGVLQGLCMCACPPILEVFSGRLADESLSPPVGTVSHMGTLCV
jgi:hypothetical protein